MSLIKTRPEIRLGIPRVIVPGDSLSARVVLRCSAPVPIDALSVELVGEGVWYTSTKDGRHRNTLGLVRLVARPVVTRTELTVGDHEYIIAFAVPQDAPPSFSGGLLSVEWEFRVRADIPWWPDAKATFVAHVAPRPSPEAAERPRVFASNTDGPQGTKPYAELSLGDVVSGEPLEGTVALSNTNHNDYRALEFRLTSSETIPSLFSARTEQHKFGTWKIALSEPRENELIRFNLRLPSVVPGFETQKLSLSWTLEVRLHLGWALDTTLWIPLNVRTRGAHDRSETSAPLAVGSDRLAAVWKQAGLATGFNYRDAELSRESGMARLVIRREHRGRRGLRLLAEARYPDIDLGLRVDGDRLRARDTTQSEMIGSHTDPKCEGLRLEHADDMRILLSVDDPGTRMRSVVDTAQRFAAFWDAFETARSVLPAPADMADAVPAFQSAARRLGGELDVASMDIRGSRHEIPFALEVQWDDQGAARTVLEVRPTLPVDARWHQRWNGGPRSALPRGLEALVDGARSVEVDAEAIRVVFPACGREVLPMVERVEGMLEVARGLSGQGAGYR